MTAAIKALNITRNTSRHFPIRNKFIPQRNLFSWLYPFFNSVDRNRINEVGPDRACAEWLLKNGASVKWSNSDNFLKDYNSLPVTANRNLKVQEVDATDSSIMNIGFPYFHGLNQFDTLKLINCK